jgi:hypothetical protein
MKITPHAVFGLVYAVGDGLALFAEGYKFRGQGSSTERLGENRNLQGQCPLVQDEETPNLTSVSEVNEPGFGDLNNKYSLGMATFKDHVYVGTLNAPGFPSDLLPWFLGNPLESTGAKVYRGKSEYDEWEWEEVLNFGDYNDNNFGVRQMLAVDDYLYLVTANHEGTAGNGVEVWSTSDGVTWSQKSDPGFGIPSNISGRSLAACGGYLYVGVENRATGAQLWRHLLVLADGDLSSSGVWEQVVDDGFDNPNNYFISALVLNPFPGGDNSLYAGTINGFDGMELWKIMSCQKNAVADVVTLQVFGGGWPGPSECPLPSIGPINLCVTNSGALTLQTATINIPLLGSKPALFLGTVNYILGASLFVSIDGTNFLPVILFGNGDDRLSYVWSMQEYMGRLYIGTFQRPNLRNLLDLPSDFDLDVTSVDLLDPEQVETYMSFLEDLGGSFDTPALPGITNNLLDLDNLDLGDLDPGNLDLDEVVESGEFTLFSVDLSPDFFFSLVKLAQGNPLVTVDTETLDSFGSCYQYGVRTMSVYNDKLILGSAGASSKGGTLVFEATARTGSP